MVLSVLMSLSNRYNYNLADLRGDFLGGVTAAMVMLPISLAYGEATGLGAAVGLYGAIAVGFFAAAFGGTRSQISGPTGPMTVTMVVILAAGTPAGQFAAIVMLAGLTQIVLGAIRPAQVISYVPGSIISGFMTGIGILVILMQIAPFAGQAPVFGGIIKVISSLPETIANVNFQAIIVAGVTLLAAFLWPERLRTYLPAPLAAVLVGSVAAMAAGPVAALFWPDAPPLPVVAEVSTGWPTLHLPEWHLPDWEHPEFNMALTVYMIWSIKLALVGSVDSLMNARMADSMTETRHRPNRELVAQGIGNVAAGFIGGLPGSANTAATVVNIKSGGGRIAGVFCALILLALTPVLGPLVRNIPIAVLAGVLVKVGLDLIDWRQLLEFARPVRRKYLLLTALNAMLAAALAGLWPSDQGLFLSPSEPGLFLATSLGMAVPLMASWRWHVHFPWLTLGRQKHYELSLMTLAAVLTVFDVLATMFVGLLFSVLPGTEQQTGDDDTNGGSDGVG